MATNHQYNVIIPKHTNKQDRAFHPEIAFDDFIGDLCMLLPDNFDNQQMAK